MFYQLRKLSNEPQMFVQHGPSYMAVLLNMTDYADGFLVAPALPHLSPRLSSNDSEVLKNCSSSTGLGAIYALKLA